MASQYKPLAQVPDKLDTAWERKSCFISVSEITLTNIDIVSQQFSAQGALCIFWADKELQNKAEQNGEPLPRVDGKFVAGYSLVDDSSNIPLNPKIPFHYLSEYEVTDTGFSHDQWTGGTMYKLFFKATFSQQMVLNYFPFDRILAKFSLRMRSDSWFCESMPFWWMMDGQSAIHVYENQRGLFEVRLGSTVKPEFTLFPPVTRETWGQHTEFSARLERKPDFYLMSVFLPCFIFGLISCSAFCAAMPDFPDRMSMVSTMLLTGVAFKMMVTSWLPKLSYSTTLDLYFHLTLLFWMFQVVAAVISSWHEEGVSDQIDRISVYLLSSTWFLGHVLLVFGVRRQWWYPTWEHAEASEEDDYLKLQAEDGF